MLQNPKTILITGASSGLGASLAIEYARSEISLYLAGRDEKRLNDVKKSCDERGAAVHVKALDVKDAGALAAWIDEIEKDRQIDLVIANAGISAGTGGGGEDYNQVKNIFDTNIYGVINTISPAIIHMKKRRAGQIAIISSLAGFRGLPSSPAYCASKAAVKVYGEGLRGALAKDNVALTVVTPGYIRTPMTDVNNFYMPFLMEADKAAKLIREKLAKNPARLAFPFPFSFIVWFISILSPFIIDPILAMLPEKPSAK